MSPRMKCLVSYNGSRYDGFQTQPSGNTIQDQIESALSTIGKETIHITASGRTDAKVHALGQVFHFDSDLPMEPSAWMRALNSMLPQDIHLLAVQTVSPSFHARFLVQSKEYHYLINQGQYDPFQADFCYQYGKHLDLDLMRKAATLLVGTHDYRNFCSNEEKQIVSFVRTIKSIQLKEEGDLLRLIFIGNGFLRYMVRMIVGALIEIGRKHADESIIEDRLNKASRNIIPFKAPACGLYLMKVNYDDKEEYHDDSK